MTENLAALEARLLALKREEALELARSDFSSFIHWVQPYYRMQWYHRRISKACEEVVHGKGKRIIFNLPPRHGKSEEVSKLFPAYVFGVDPNRRIIATSYSAELATINNRDVQKIMDSDVYREVFPRTLLAAMNSRAVAGRPLRNSDVFEIVERAGFYRSAGVGGAITGMGADIIIIDDPIKSEEEARSPVYRERVWQWYTNTLLTRKQPGASVLVVMTRWHEDDLVGRLLQRASEDPNADQWEEICFRAIRESDENIDDPRAEGEALWPDEYPLRELEKMRASMGESAFAGLYQQRPSLKGKAALPSHRWCYWYTGDEPPPVVAKDDEGNLITCRQQHLPDVFDLQWQSWDMAFKDLETSDWVVGQVHAKRGAVHYLLEQVRRRMDFPASVKAVKQMAEDFSRTRQKLIEDKANGPAVVSSLRSKVPGLLAVTPEGGKESRVNAISYLHEAGNLFLPHPRERSWVRAFVQECAQFPKGQYDDQVDAYSQGVNWAYNAKRKKKWGKIRVVENRW